ncbi:MAG: AgmX/PglI C-terminal domain-containing protein [Polyangiaceae bacterium]
MDLHRVFSTLLVVSFLASACSRQGRAMESPQRAPSSTARTGKPPSFKPSTAIRSPALGSRADPGEDCHVCVNSKCSLKLEACLQDLACGQILSCWGEECEFGSCTSNCTDGQAKFNVLNACIEETCGCSGSGYDEVNLTDKGADLDPDARILHDVILAGRRKLQACFEQALQRDPTVSGRLVLAVTVQTNGQVGAVRLEESTLKDPGFADCLRSASKTLTFAPRKSPVVVRYPLLFEPG